MESLTVRASELKTGDILTMGVVTGTRRWGNDRELVTVSFGNLGATQTWNVDALFSIQRDKEVPDTLNLQINIEVWADEDGYPTKVEVTGEPVEGLKTRTLLDIAQEGVNSQMGSYGHVYRAEYVKGREENRAEFKVENKSEELKERFPGNTQFPVVKNNWE